VIATGPGHGYRRERAMAGYGERDSKMADHFVHPRVENDPPSA
jgi:hypothetical protein